MKSSWWKGPKGEWYVVIQFVLFALVAFGPRRLPGFPTWGPPWSNLTLVIGLILGGIGGIFILVGLAYLGTNLSPLPHPKDDSELVETGAYRVVRHPIYAGIIIGAFGWALLRASSVILLYALILFVFFDIKSRREEKWLAKKFPAYPAYQQRVRKLIPWLY